jgi:hypothetical protein
MLRTYALALAAVFALTSAVAIPSDLRSSDTSPSYISSEQIGRELGARLSKGSTIFGPDNSSFNATTARWTLYESPRIQVVIEPAKESDIALIVSLRKLGG